MAPRWLFFFEKWYLDAVADDGSFLFTYLAPIHIAGRRTAELVVWWFPREGEPLTRSFHLSGNDLRLAPDRQRLRFSSGELSLVGDDCRFTFAVGDVELDLRLARLDPAWTPGRDGMLIGRGRNHIRWVVPLPRGRATVRGRIGKTPVALDGFGYADFVQTNTVPWRVPLRTLLWGRALGPDLCLVWERPVFGATPERRRVTRGYLRLGDGPGRNLDAVEVEIPAWTEDPRTGGRYPREMRLRFSPAGRDPSTRPEVNVLVSDTRLLLGETVADLQAFSGPVEQWIYRTATGDPITYKLLSRVRVGDQPPVWAAHELVLWGRQGRAAVGGASRSDGETGLDARR
jgi:hypothetical protein